MLEEKDTKLEYIAVERLVPNPLNHFEIEGIEDMKNSILSNGIVTPLTVIGPTEDDNYILISGERRLTAVKALLEEGKTQESKLPCYVKGTIDMSKIEQEILIEVSNVETRDIANKPMHYMRIVRLIKQMAEEEGLSKKEEVQLRKNYMKCSDRYARFFNQVFNEGTEELKEMVENNEISVSRAGRLASLSTEQQKEAIHEIKSGKSQDQTIKEIAKKNKTSASPTTETPFKDDACLEQANPMTTSNAPESLPADTDLDEMWGDLDIGGFTMDSLSLDSTQSLNRYHDLEGVSGKEELEIVTSWCAKIQKTSSLTEAEWEAVECCRKVVEKFFS